MGAIKRREVYVRRVPRGATRCGKLWQIMFAPHGVYSSAKLVLAAELFSATLYMCIAVFAEPLPEGGSVMGGQGRADKPIDEIHRDLRENNLAS